MSKQGIVTTGVVAFSKLTEHDVYNGKSTGAYSLTITMEPNEAAKLEDMGVKVKEYQKDAESGVKLQRKFRSQFHVPVVDLDGHPVQGEIPFGSVVRVLWTSGDMSPEHGLSTYLNKVRLVEVAENEGAEPEEF